MEFSKHFKALREAAGLSQAQVAKEVGVSPAMIRSYEEKDTIPKTSLCYKLSRAMGDSEYLLCDLRYEALYIRSAIRQGRHLPKVLTTGEELRKLRFKKELTKEDVAIRSGIPISDVYWIEADVIKPNIIQLGKLSKALNAPFGDLAYVSLMDNSIPVPKRIARTLGIALEDATYDLYEAEESYFALKVVVEAFRQQIAEESYKAKGEENE